MFRRLSEPLPLSEASLLALRPAMNAPVLNVNFLPVGPARAAIVAFAEEYGGIGIALGIRANDGGHIAVLRNQESLDFDTPISQALEPLLEEAERMGFLFDEDMLAVMAGDKGRAHAMGLWARLMGEVEMPPAPRAVPAQPAANEPILELSDARVLVDNPANIEMPELDLDDLADFELEAELSEDDGILELDLAMDDALPPELELESALEVPKMLELKPDELKAEKEPESRPALPPKIASQPKVESIPAVAREDVPPEPAIVPPARAAGSVMPPPVRRATDPTPQVAQKPAAARGERRASAAKAKTAARKVAAPARETPTDLPPSVPVPATAETPTQAPEQTLSKFRNVEQVAAQTAALPPSVSTKGEGDGGNELGRIPLVRIRRERDGSKRVPYLARLLSSF